MGVVLFTSRLLVIEKARPERTGHNIGEQQRRLAQRFGLKQSKAYLYKIWNLVHHIQFLAKDCTFGDMILCQNGQSPFLFQPWLIQASSQSVFYTYIHLVWRKHMLKVSPFSYWGVSQFLKNTIISKFIYHSPLLALGVTAKDLLRMQWQDLRMQIIGVYRFFLKILSRKSDKKRLVSRGKSFRWIIYCRLF